MGKAIRAARASPERAEIGTDRHLILTGITVDAKKITTRAVVVLSLVTRLALAKTLSQIAIAQPTLMTTTDTIAPLRSLPSVAMPVKTVVAVRTAESTTGKIDTSLPVRAAPEIPQERTVGVIKRTRGRISLFQHLQPHAIVKKKAVDMRAGIVATATIVTEVTAIEKESEKVTSTRGEQATITGIGIASGGAHPAPVSTTTGTRIVTETEVVTARKGASAEVASDTRCLQYNSSQLIDL